MAAKHGADPADIKKVEALAAHFGLNVKAALPAERSVLLEGTAAAFMKAFRVDLRTHRLPDDTWYRGRHGTISIPKELDEAALIDGAGHMQMLLKIFIPVALPGIIAATIFAFTVSWAAFVYPIAFLFSADQQVLTVGTVTSLIKADVYKWGMLMAGALVAAAPPLVVYAFLMDYYIAGLTAGATKG